MPRYYNQPNLALTYQSTYDPSFDNNLVNLQTQEGQKANMAVAAMSERDAQIGDVFSHDLKGKQETVDAYKSKLDRVKEVYNNDLALAAPALASAIAKERQNPWYQKNALYNQELERKQKLTDQFGPNILFNKDLPQLGDKQSLNNMAMEDIGFDYVNLQHVQQILGQQFGALAKKKTDLGLKDLHNGFMAFGERLGLSEAELNKVKSGNPEFLDSILKQSGIEPTEQTRSTLMNYVGTWMDTNLLGKDDWKEVADPYAMVKWKAKEAAKAKGQFNIPGAQINSGVYKAGEKSFTASSIGATNIVDLQTMNSNGDPAAKLITEKLRTKLTTEELSALDSAPSLSINEPWLKSIKGYNEMPEEKKIQFVARISGDIKNSASTGWDLLDKASLSNPMLAVVNYNRKIMKSMKPESIVADAINEFGLNHKIDNRFMERVSKVEDWAQSKLGVGELPSDNKEQNDIIRDGVSKFNKSTAKWNENVFSKVEQSVNKKLNEINIESQSTPNLQFITGQNNKIASDLTENFLLNSGVESIITNEKGRQATKDLQNDLRSGYKITLVTLEPGSEVSTNNMKVAVTKANETKFYNATINEANAEDFFMNMGKITDTLAPINSIYSKNIYAQTFAKGKESIGLQDIANTNVYQQYIPVDQVRYPNISITRNKELDFVFTNPDVKDQSTGEPFRYTFNTLAEATDYALKVNDIIPKYLEEYITYKIQDNKSNKEKNQFLGAMLNSRTLTQDEALGFGYDPDEIDTDNGN